ncbi:MAG: DUF2281 domain-containing protein [Pyrinomonadaceae bacterium]
MIAEDILIQKINALPPDKIGEVIDFVDFLANRGTAGWRAERTAEIAAYASEFGGTEFDLDEDLEAAAGECLLAIDEASQ